MIQTGGQVRFAKMPDWYCNFLKWLVTCSTAVLDVVMKT
jgi:hypothetical protein